jgi:hypothetical protein
VNFKVLSQHLPGGTGKPQKTLRTEVCSAPYIKHVANYCTSLFSTSLQNFRDIVPYELCHLVMKLLTISDLIGNC